MITFAKTLAAIVAIGIVCLLYIDKRINISAKVDKSSIIYFQRQPRDEKEWKRYLKDNGWHGKGIDK